MAVKRPGRVGLMPSSSETSRMATVGWVSTNGSDTAAGARSGGPIGMGAVVRGQFLGNAMQPFVELRLRPGVERREGADDSGLALGDHEVGAGDDEERRADHGEGERVEQRGKRHMSFIAQP